jgi:endonuclease/exonuclease/phosphatase family metal-dependent hydrolase
MVPFLQSGNYWFIAIWGLLFPFLAAVLFIILIYYSIKKSRRALMPLIALLLSWQQLSVLFSLNKKKEFSYEKQDSSIRILSWNVSRWDEPNKKKRGGVSYRPLMLDMIKMQGADILCFQEFFECYSPDQFEATIPVIKKMGYDYHYFFPTEKIYEGAYQYGVCIFSRFPIIDSAGFNPVKSRLSEGIAYADIQIHSKKIRVFATHFESPGLSRDDYDNNTVNLSRTVLSKLKASYSIRNEQAVYAKQLINASPYPAIVSADVNDVPNSFAYFTLKKGMKDAFLEKGSGLGQTFRFISPTLRIDYLFTSNELKVKQYTTLKLPYSDHYPIITDLLID